MKKKFSQLTKGTQWAITYCVTAQAVTLVLVIMPVIKNVGGF